MSKFNCEKAVMDLYHEALYRTTYRTREDFETALERLCNEAIGNVLGIEMKIQEMMADDLDVDLDVKVLSELEDGDE